MRAVVRKYRDQLKRYMTLLQGVDEAELLRISKEKAALDSVDQVDVEDLLQELASLHVHELLEKLLSVGPAAALRQSITRALEDVRRAKAGELVDDTRRIQNARREL